MTVAGSIHWALVNPEHSNAMRTKIKLILPSPASASACKAERPVLKESQVRENPNFGRASSRTSADGILGLCTTSTGGMKNVTKQIYGDEALSRLFPDKKRSL